MQQRTLCKHVLLLSTLVLCVSRLPAASPPAFYVATNGSDGWSGKIAAPDAAKSDGPFASLEKARDAIRQLRKTGTLPEGATVFVRNGVYTLAQGLKLEAQDSGTTGAPVVYRAFESEKPVLIGGRPITAFTPHQGAILKADVAAQGFKGIYFRQLIFDGKRQHLARYPNFDSQNPYGGGWAYADGKPTPMYQNQPDEDKHSLLYKPQDAREWKQPGEVEVFVFPRYNWWNNIVPIKSIDGATRLITLAKDASYAIRPGDRYYFQNALEELDAPGEWFLDRRTWTLYFWPPSPLAGRAVYAPTTRTILEIGPGTSHVTFRGFIMECAEGDAVVLNRTTNCLIAASTIRNVGDYHGVGVAVNGGAHNGVIGCDIFETGSHGIHLSGGDRKTLTPAENVAENNYIHHVGVFYKQGVGVSLNGVGNRVAHNLIHDGPRMGIMFSGNDLVIEFNHIRHMNLETEDTGAVYTGGRDWISSRGTVIRYNYFHDMLGYGKDASGKWISPHFAWGVYLDDNTGGVDVFGNIVARCSRAGLHLHNGRDNHIENNIFIENGQQQYEYSGWTSAHSYWKEHLPTMIRGYESVAGEPAWKNMRNMQLHPTNAVLADGKIMTGNEFVRNIIYYRNPQAKLVRFGTVPYDHNLTDSNLVFHFDQPLRTGQKSAGKESNSEWVAWQALGNDQHSLIADPLFVSPEQDDFRLKAESPAFKLGFKPIPVEKIGPYSDPRRATWPIVEAEGAREKPLMSAGKP